MRLLAEIAALLVIVLGVPLEPLWPQSGAPSGGLRSTLKLGKTRFSPGEEIWLSYSVRNISDRPVTIWHAGFWPNHDVLVRDAAGLEPALTAFGESARRQFAPGAPRFKNVPVVLSPGASDDTQGRIDLTRLYALPPGRYTVQVVYEEKQTEWSGRLASNAAPFEIAN